MYSPHVRFSGALKTWYSFDAHVIGALAREVDSRPLMRYVKGLIRYMKIQKPGRA
jgi:hypothetical protein